MGLHEIQPIALTPRSGRRFAVVAEVVMSWHWSPGGVLTVTGALGMAALAGVAWRRRSGKEAAWLTLTLVATAVWGLAYSLELAASTTSARQAWGDVKYVGICALPPAWVMFVSAYTGRTAWLRPRTILLLAVEPVLVLALLANGHTHDLIRYYPAGSTSRVAHAGALFWPHSIYTYLVLWAATALLVVRLGRLSPVYRRQSVVLVVSLAVPFLCNLLFNAGVPPFDAVDLTPFAFLGSAVVLVWGVLRFQLVGLRPVARSHIFTTTGDLVVTLDPRHHVIDANPAAAAAFGLPAHRLIGRHVETLLPHAQQAIRTSGGEPPAEDNIGDRVFELNASTLTDRRSRLLGTVLIAHDVTARKDVERRLSQQALHDPLTGAANRTLYFDRLSHALDHASRTRRPVAVLFIDLDSFKQINDALGHAVGDEVLVAVGRRLRSSVRKADTVARMGGDEFAVLLEDFADDRDVARAAAHIRSSLSLPIYAGGHRLTMSASIGVATGLDLQPDELVRLADESMYAEKKEEPGPEVPSTDLPRPRGPRERR